MSSLCVHADRCDIIVGINRFIWMAEKEASRENGKRQFIARVVCVRTKPDIDHAFHIPIGPFLFVPFRVFAATASPNAV